MAAVPTAPRPYSPCSNNTPAFIIKRKIPPKGICLGKISVRFKNRVGGFCIPEVEGFWQVLIRDDAWRLRQPNRTGLSPGGKARLTSQGVQLLKGFGINRNVDTDAKFYVFSIEVLQKICASILSLGWDTFLEQSPRREMFEELSQVGLSHAEIDSMRILEPGLAPFLVETWETKPQEGSNGMLREPTGYVLTRIHHVETTRSIMLSLLAQPPAKVDIRLCWKGCNTGITDRDQLKRLLT
jgi:hypothetical protein